MSNARLKLSVHKNEGWMARQLNGSIIVQNPGYLEVHATLPGDTPDSCIVPIVEAELEQALDDLLDDAGVVIAPADRIYATLPLMKWSPIDPGGCRFTTMVLARKWNYSGDAEDEDDCDYEDEDEDYEDGDDVYVDADGESDY